jgi:hypothetical protein
MTPSISPVLLRPARSILVVGLVAVASLGCAAAATTGGGDPSPASAGPSSSPTTGPSFHIALKDDVGSGATVDIVDLSGTLVGARAAELNERAPNPAAPTSGDVTVQNVDAATLWIAWTSGNCPDAHTLTIDPTGRSISISQPPFCGGDTIGVGRQLVLSFNRPIAAAEVTATLVRLGQ